MNKFLLNRYHLSEIFWSVIYEKGAFIAEKARDAIISALPRIESSRAYATYNTGSISLSASVCLALLTNYFRPNIVAEVGTFIGRSTYSIALGCNLDNGTVPKIHTCDHTNNIILDPCVKLGEVIQYPKASSTEMLSAIVESGESPDMYFWDGRVQEQDLELMGKINAQKSVIVLDDFEGVEKGVVNAMVILNAFKGNFLLIYPKATSSFNVLGVYDPSTIALLIPKDMIAFVNQ